MSSTLLETIDPSLLESINKHQHYSNRCAPCLSCSVNDDINTNVEQFLDRKIDIGLERVVISDFDDLCLISMRDYLSSLNFEPCVMIAHKGSVIFENNKYRSVNDCHVWTLCYRLISCFVISSLIDCRQINVSSPISSHISELKGTLWDVISIENVINSSYDFEYDEIVFEKIRFGLNTDRTDELECYGENLVSRHVSYLRKTRLNQSSETNENIKRKTFSLYLLIAIIECITKVKLLDYWCQEVLVKMTHKGHLFSDLIQHRKLLASGLYHITPEDLLSYVMLFTPSSNIISTKKTTNIYGKECFQSNAGAVIGSGLIHKSIITDVAENSCSSHWDYIFEEGAMFMHDGMEQGIYLDVKRDFCAIFFDNVSEFNQVTFDSFLPLYFRSISKQLR